MIDTDHFRHARLTHQGLEGLQSALKLLIGLGSAGQQVAAITVTHRQRVATLPVAQQEPAFEVHRPNVIGPRGHGQPVVECDVHSRFASALHAQPVPPENLTDSAAGRRRLNAMLHFQNLVQLLGPPSPMQPTLG